MKKLILINVFFSISFYIFGQTSIDKNVFRDLSSSTLWEKKFDDKCTGNWQKKWFLDGMRAEVINSEKGMLFNAGPVIDDNSCHAVLWTKASFEGDIKIEYDYVRTDDRTQQVNIIYIQATGTGTPPYSKDISEWNDLRIIPYMKTYYTYMKCLHVSYAAFENTGKAGTDYIRARMYPVKPGADFNSTTEIPPASSATGLFVPGVNYKITFIKSNNKLYFNVENKDVSKLFSWDLSSFPMVNEGRVGLRHMNARSALYSNFRIYTKAD